MMRPLTAKKPMDSIYTLQVVLELRDDSGITADEVVERTMDAIFAYCRPRPSVYRAKDAGRRIVDNG
jgi:hypothetical protein